MDRGVKVAIFVASIVSLALGLIWDQVLSQARNAVQREIVDELGPDVMLANVGPPDVARLAPPEEFPVQAPENLPDPKAPAVAPDAPQVTLQERWQEYTVQAGDSWWRLAHTTFKERGLSTKDLMDANPGKDLRPGVVLRIPPIPGAVGVGINPPAAADQPRVAGYAAEPPPAPPALPSHPSEYTVQDGDSWWLIANRRMKEVGKTSDEWEAANPGIGTLRPGMKIKVPR